MGGGDSDSDGGGGGKSLEGGGSFCEVDNWLGSSSYATQAGLQQPEAPLVQSSPTRGCSMGCSLADQKWDIWFHFNERNPVKRGIYETYISFLNLQSLIASEGYGESDYMYYVKEEEIGSERVKYLGNETSVHEMLEVYNNVKVLNIKVVRNVQPASSAQAHENYMNTQESCSVKKVVEQSELHNQINDRKAQLEKSRIEREADLNHFEGDTEVSEFCSGDSVHTDGSVEVVEMEIECASEEDRALEIECACEEDRALELTAIVKHVKNPGPTRRCHNEVEHKQIEDWFPEAGEFCFAGDSGMSDEEEEDENELPYLLKKAKSNKKKMKDRVWFDPSIPNSHLLLCKSLCFESVYQFKEALRDFHIRTLRSFHYHRNSLTRIIAWCSQKEHECEFFMCASRIAHERTFCINKCNMKHTCPASIENTKVTTKWLSKAVEPSLRVDPRTRVDALIKDSKVKFLVDVSRSVAYGARRKAIKVVQGDQKE
ncbi:Protein FAR1-RELATED SEQUENCE 5 [Hordeum vulgare]|nr:Protein FAR1-RELATED SEQUENCE 5 [Hordeum vulgare]